MPRILRLGARGPDVRELQLALAWREFARGSIDGVFGSLTDGAVRQFQAQAKIQVDGVVGPETRGALAARPAPTPADPCPPALDDGALPEGTVGVWIHRLDLAITRAGGVPELVGDLRNLRVGLVLIKVLDGRALMNQGQVGAVVTALHAAGIKVAFWAWVYAVYYSKNGVPETPYHATVEYLEDQARLLVAQARRHHCTAILYANVEGEGAWSTGAGAALLYGPRNIRFFGSQAAADAAIAERLDAYAQALDAELPGALTVCSTHGDPSTQRLPWRTMCRVFKAVAPQLYNPGTEGWRRRVARTSALWRGHGAKRIRISGPAWKQGTAITKPAWITQLREELRLRTGSAATDVGADWWVYELMTDAQRAQLLAPLEAVLNERSTHS